MWKVVYPTTEKFTPSSDEQNLDNKESKTDEPNETGNSDEPEDPDAPDFKTPEGMATIFGQAGFTNIRHTTQEKVFLSQSFEDWWQFIWSTGWRSALEPITEVSKFKLELEKEFEARKREEGFLVTIKTLFTLGEKT